MALADQLNRGALYRVDSIDFTEGYPLTSWWLVQGRTGGSTQLPRDGEAADQARRSGWYPSGIVSQPNRKIGFLTVPETTTTSFFRGGSRKGERGKRLHEASDTAVSLVKGLCCPGDYPPPSGTT